MALSDLQQSDDPAVGRWERGCSFDWAPFGSGPGTGVGQRRYVFR